MKYFSQIPHKHPIISLYTKKNPLPLPPPLPSFSFSTFLDQLLQPLSLSSPSVPPQIAKDQHDYTVVISNPLQLPCEVQGNPTPVITWRKDGEVLDPGSLDPDQISILPNGALRITSAAPGDAGMYECVATSIAGNATKVIEVFVQGRINARGSFLGIYININIFICLMRVVYICIHIYIYMYTYIYIYISYIYHDMYVCLKLVL